MDTIEESLIKQSPEEQSPEEQLLEPGTLWTQTVTRTQTALESGALQPIATDWEWMEQNGIRFLVRTLVNLGRKETARQVQKSQEASSGKPFNPFLPYDPALFVSHLSATHTCLLNKYNVVEHHWLIVTRQFEPQEAWLNLADLAALWMCLKEIDGLGFYNSSRLAGASQPHKHLQLLPLPLTPTDAKVPIEAAFATAVWQDGVGVCSGLPFRHALARLFWDETASPEQAAQITLAAYHRLLTALDLQLADTPSHPQPDPPAYNFLITREWLLLIPRRQEQFESISVNALGFAGTLFVRDAAQFERLKAIGPLALLNGVAVPQA